MKKHITFFALLLLSISYNMNTENPTKAEAAGAEAAKILYEELTPTDFRQRISDMPVAFLPLGTMEWIFMETWKSINLIRHNNLTGAHTGLIPQTLKL
jgi:hypothetical protein